MGEQQLTAHGQWSSHLQPLARAVGNLIGHGIELLMAVVREIRATRLVWRTRPLMLSLEPLFAQTVRVGKVATATPVQTINTLGHTISPLGICQCLAQRLCDAINVKPCSTLATQACHRWDGLARISNRLKPSINESTAFA